MNSIWIKYLNIISKSTGLFLLHLFLVLLPVSTHADSITISIHLRGIYSSRISLLPLAGPNALKPVVVIDSVKNGGIAVIKVPEENLAGEFVLRFDYKDKASSTPYFSKKGRKRFAY